MKKKKKKIQLPAILEKMDIGKMTTGVQRSPTGGTDVFG